MSKYGLQLRLKPSQQKQPTRPPRPILGFNDEDDNDVEGEISRQAIKKKALKDTEEQHKKALEEDPSIFDYDGVYDEMKEKVVRPRVLDREERKPKYIQNLVKKAQEREREREVIYERKLAKERNQDDHLYADKDKFVTGAYKRKLAEQAKWMEEERLRQLREEKDDVTKKSDMSDFYFNLEKNVAFGAKGAEQRKLEKKQLAESEKDEQKAAAESSDKPQSSKYSSPPSKLAETKEEQPGDDHTDTIPIQFSEAKPATSHPVQENALVEQSSNTPKVDHHKRGNDELAAARERFLARKRAKE